MTSERSRASQRAGRHRTGLASLAARVVESLGGRYSVELGIDVDANEDEIERWALAATLFGARISATIAKRTFAILEQAGVLAPWIPSPEQSFVEKAANSPRQIDPDWIDQDPIRDPAAATELLFHDCDHATLQTLHTDLAAG